MWFDSGVPWRLGHEAARSQLSEREPLWRATARLLAPRVYEAVHLSQERGREYVTCARTRDGAWPGELTTIAWTNTSVAPDDGEGSTPRCRCLCHPEGRLAPFVAARSGRSRLARMVGSDTVILRERPKKHTWSRRPSTY